MKILIDDILKKKNKTRYWLSNEIDLGYQSLMRICNNETSSIRFEILEKICLALDCTPNDIIQIESIEED